MGIRKMRYEKNVDSCAEIGSGYKWLFGWIKPTLAGKKVLNVGCWTGVLEKLLVKTNCSLTGIDIEESALKVAQKEFPAYKFVKASIVEPLPFNKSFFDVVLFFMTIEHLPKNTEVIALKQLNKVLKKKGILYLSTMNNNLLSILSDPVYFSGHRHYSLNHLETILAKSGFTVKEKFTHGGFGIIVYTLLFYFYKHILRKTFYSSFIDRWMSEEYEKRDGFLEVKIKAQKTRDVA